MINLVEIELDSLIPGTNAGVNIFIERNNDYILYSKKDNEFTERHRQRLLDSHARKVYIAYDDNTKFQEYLENNMSKIVADPEMPVEKKSAYVYNNTKQVVENLFENPRSGNMIKQSKSVIKHSVNLIVNEKDALKHLVSVMSNDYYTYSHSINVTIFSIALAQRLLGDDKSIDFLNLGQGFLLHDLGKSLIAPEIINKPSKLDDEEWAIMKRHPEMGFELIGETEEITDEISLIVLQHHERYKGGGYPEGKKGKAIHTFGRICCVADVFDALTTVRSYRRAMSSYDALTLMGSEMTGHFDPSYLKEFVVMFKF